MNERPDRIEAQAALDRIESSRLQVIREIDVPRWYWWGLALGWVALGLITDTGIAWLSVLGTIAFGAVHSVVAQHVVDGRHRTSQLSVRADVAGRRVQFLIFGGLVVLVLVTIGVAVAASAAGSSYPATIASLVVAALILLGGPRLMASVRHRAAAASVA